MKKMKKMKTFKEFINESVVDYLQPKSKEEIEKIKKTDKGIIIENTFIYNKEKMINYINKYSKKLNKSFEIMNKGTSEWTYIWSYNNMFLSIDKESYNKYIIKFSNNRNSLLKIKDMLNDVYPLDKSYLIIKFYFLENALNFLKKCGIDTEKIKQNHIDEMI